MDKPGEAVPGGRSADPGSPAGRGELAAIERLRHRLGTPPPGELWLGDDAAVVEAPGGPLLLAADSLVDGVHFSLRWSSWADVGWKAMAVNLSDLAAMGGRAHRALVTVAGPEGTDLDRLYDGILEASGAYDCPVVGGDLTAAPVLVITVAVTGGLAPGVSRPVRRDGAAPGDLLLVTGALGAAAAGLAALRRGEGRGEGVDRAVAAHRRPRPRLSEGALMARSGASAMIDVSDGAAIDLWRLAVASGLSVELDGLPVAEGATTVEALAGGDDYELVLALPARKQDDLRSAFSAAALDQPILIGRCAAGPPGRLALEGREISPQGWEHRL